MILQQCYLFIILIVCCLSTFSESRRQFLLRNGQWVVLTFNGDQSLTTAWNGKYQFVRRSVGCLDGGPLIFKSSQSNDEYYLHRAFASFDRRGSTFDNIDYVSRTNYTMQLLSDYEEEIVPAIGTLLRDKPESARRKSGLSKYDFENRIGDIKKTLYALADYFIDNCNDDCLWELNIIIKNKQLIFL